MRQLLNNLLHKTSCVTVIGTLKRPFHSHEFFFAVPELQTSAMLVLCHKLFWNKCQTLLQRLTQLLQNHEFYLG